MSKPQDIDHARQQDLPERSKASLGSGPPSSTVEEEIVALAQELQPSPPDVGGCEARSRGSLDQHPMILNKEEEDMLTGGMPAPSASNTQHAQYQEPASAPPPDHSLPELPLPVPATQPDPPQSPQNVPAAGQFYCRELDGTYTLRTTTGIVASCQPGLWKTTKTGYPYFVRGLDAGEVRASSAESEQFWCRVLDGNYTLLTMADFVRGTAAGNEQFYCRELDGMYSLRTVEEIVRTCLPGIWKTPKTGYPFFVCDLGMGGE
ncbi:MAG: hypothetical protein Q9218_007936 [Villophora microphyllina]